MDGFSGFFSELGVVIRRSVSGGKRLRPALVVATHDSLGGTCPPDAVHTVAAAFELLHTAFIVHDDVIDHDIVRRGAPNVVGALRAHAAQAGATQEGAALVGDAAAILAGDLLLHEAQRLIALAPLDDDRRRALLDILDEAVLVSAAGELADVVHSVVADEPDADAILAATHDKTAVYSFSAPLRAGAVLAGAQETSVAALARVGSRLGLAYQLVDDLIGAFGTASEAGRESGADLREAKQTALIALARHSSTWPDVREAIDAAWTGPIAVERAQLALGASGARLAVETMVEETLDDARRVSATLPEATHTMISELIAAVEARVP